MALRGSSPVNLNALRRDYSALPQIAAIKAQANQGIFNAIQSGLEKRKDNIEKAEKKELNIKLLNQIIENDKKNQFVPAGVTAEELSKYVPIEETLKYAQAMGLANQELRKERQLRKAAQGLASVIPGMDEKTKRQLSRANPKLLIELGLKAQQGKDPNYELKEVTDAEGNKRIVRVNIGEGTSTNITQQQTSSTPPQASSVPPQVRLPGGLTASRVDPKTGRPPAQSAPSGEPLTSFPSLAERNAAEKARRDADKARRELQAEDVLNLYRSQSRKGPVDISGIAKILKLNESVVRGIVEENLDKIRGESFSKLQEMEKSFPGITEYVARLAQIDPTKGQGQSSGFLGMGREFEASDFGDVNSIPKFNVFLRANPEILRIYGVPENAIAEIIGLQLPKKLGSGTEYSEENIDYPIAPRIYPAEDQIQSGLSN